MGLDMYLTRKVYIGGEFEHNNVKGEVSLTRGEDNRPVNANLSRLSQMEFSEITWRKTNAVHRWFVENVQDGIDDCKEYYVEREQLETLLETCKKVLASCKLVNGQVNNGAILKNGECTQTQEDGKVIEDPSVAKELLPSQGGFFFGGTGYDQWYVYDLEYTIDELERVLKENEYGDFYYQSSW